MILAGAASPLGSSWLWGKLGAMREWVKKWAAAWRPEPFPFPPHVETT